MREYQAISADSHLEVPIDRWVHRIPAQYRDQAPKRIKLEGGGEAQTIEGGPVAVEPKRTEDSRSWPQAGTSSASPTRSDTTWSLATPSGSSTWTGASCRTRFARMSAARSKSERCR